MSESIDGAPTTAIKIGGQASLAMNDMGLGFISYIQKEDYENPTLKIALQEALSTFLPVIRR